MGIIDINNNPKDLKNWIDNEKAIAKQYYIEHSNSLVLLFEKELRELGFVFEISSQTLSFMPKHKKRFYLLQLNIINWQRNSKITTNRIIL